VTQTPEQLYSLRADGTQESVKKVAKVVPPDSPLTGRFDPRE